MAAPPAWLAHLTNEITPHLHALDVLAPVGCHYYHNRARDEWELTLFISSTETVGGEFDGRISSSKFHVDVQGLLHVFSTIESFHWQALPLGPEDELGPHLSVEGTYQEQTVWLRILATSPDRFEPGRLVHARTMKLEDVW
jgi:hypothetical protein